MVAKGQWRDYENGKKKEYREFVRKAREFTYSNSEPPWEYRNKGGKGGRPEKNEPGALVICLLLKIWLGKPYRDLVSFLDESRSLWPITGLKALPGRMDLQRAMNRLTKDYLAQLNSFIVEQGYYGKKDARRRGRREEPVPSTAQASP